jgi:hypothetical protein
VAITTKKLIEIAKLLDDCPQAFKKDYAAGDDPRLEYWERCQANEEKALNRHLKEMIEHENYIESIIPEIPEEALLPEVPL